MNPSRSIKSHLYIFSQMKIHFAFLNASWGQMQLTTIFFTHRLSRYIRNTNGRKNTSPQFMYILEQYHSKHLSLQVLRLQSARTQTPKNHPSPKQRISATKINTKKHTTDTNKIQDPGSSSQSAPSHLTDTTNSSLVEKIPRETPPPPIK